MSSIGNIGYRMHSKVGPRTPVLLVLSTVLNLLMSPLIAMDEEKRGEDSPVDFSSHSIKISFSPSPSFQSFEEIEDDVKKQYPHFFQGSDKLDLEALDVYRKSWVNFKGKNKDTFSVVHNPVLLPALEKLKQDLASYAEIKPGHAAIANRFIHEIQFYEEIGGVSPCWFERLPLRFLCAISTFSPEERDFVFHLTEPYPTTFLALQENEAWKNHESSVESMERYNKVLRLPTYQHSILSQEAIQKIKENIERALPAQMVVSLWGKGKLGVAFVVKAMLDDIFLISAPLKSVSAHGIPLSPYGFAVHDLFHKSVDHRHFKFIEHIIDQGEKYLSYGGSIQTFLSVFLPSALCKYQGIINGLKEIYQRLIRTFDQIDSRKAMLGFFWILHEEPNFPSVLYTVKNFDDILRIITEDDGKHDTFINAEIDQSNIPLDGKIKNQPKPIEMIPVKSITAGVDLEDHFETSPIDGTSQWADEKIMAWVLKNKTVREARKYELMGYSGEDDEHINEDDIVFKSVKRSPRYIDVAFILRDGEELVYSFQTLFYNMQATHDALSLLKLINIKTALPNLSSADDPRVIARHFIKKGEDDIDGLIIHFRKVASLFANEDIPEKGSLVKRYEKLYDMSNLSLL